MWRMQLKLFIMQTAWLRQSRAAFSSVVVANGWSSRSKSLAWSVKKVWSIPLGWRLQQVSATPVYTYTRRSFAASSSAVKPIRLSLRVLQVRAAQSSSANGEECAICFDQLPRAEAEAQVCTPNSCSHRFCFPCLQTYMRFKMNDETPQEPTCPLCRAPFDVILKGDGSVFLPEDPLLYRVFDDQLEKFMFKSASCLASVQNGSKSLIDCAWNDAITALQLWKWERHTVDIFQVRKIAERITGSSLMLIASISLGRFQPKCASCNGWHQDPQKIYSTSSCWHFFHVRCLLQAFKDITPWRCPVCNVSILAYSVFDGSTSEEGMIRALKAFRRQYSLSMLSLLKVEQERLSAENNAASRENSNKVLEIITECINTIEYIVIANQSPRPFRCSPESLIRKLKALRRTT